MLDYHDDDKDLYVRDIWKIAYNYFLNGLIIDLLACIPFFSIFASALDLSTATPFRGYNWLYIVYALKIGRFYKASRITSPRYIKNIVDNVYSAQRRSYIRLEQVAKDNNDLSSLEDLRDPT